MKTKKNTLKQVEEHCEAGWIHDGNGNFNINDCGIIANDLRTLAGRSGTRDTADGDKATSLCYLLLPAAYHKMDLLVRYIDVFQKMFGKGMVNHLSERLMDEYAIAPPAVEEMVDTADQLYNYSEGFQSMMIADEITKSKSFMVKLEEEMLHAADLLCMGACWLRILLTNFHPTDSSDVTGDYVKENEGSAFTFVGA